jgi:predicted thioesterase
MTAEGPKAGLTHRRSLIVDPSVIVPALPRLLGPLSDMPPVPATACVVAVVEAACFDALKPFPNEGQKTVGAACRSQPCGSDAHGHAGDRPGGARRRGRPQAAL